MAYIGSSPTKVVSRQSANIFTYTATANQTAFTGSDANGNTLACSPSDIMVHMNGIKLEESDYTATTTTVTLVSGAAVGDEVTITAFLTFESADHYTKSAADTRYVNASGDTMSGDLTIDTNTFHVDVADNRVGIGTTTPVHDLQIHKATASSQARIQMTTNESGTTNGDGYAVAMEAGNRVYHWLYENAPMQFATNNTLNMVINANGSVTKPNQPAFMSYKNGSHLEASGHNRVQSWTEHFDVGSHFDNSTGRFVAPIAGKYFFTFNAMHSGNVSGDLQFKIYKNGNEYIKSNDTSDGGSWDQCTVVCIMDMAVNDYAEPYQYSNTNSNSEAVYNGKYSGWMGYLLG